MRTTTALTATLTLTIAALTGCTPVNGGFGPSASPEGTPGDRSCDTLVMPDVMYDFNPNFALLPRFEPEEGTAAAAALTYSGLACRWQNVSNRVTIDIAIAQVDDATLITLREAALDSSQIAADQVQDETYFVVNDGVGHEQVFHGSFWISADSVAFAQAADAAELIQSVIESARADGA